MLTDGCVVLAGSAGAGEKAVFLDLSRNAVFADKAAACSILPAHHWRQITCVRASLLSEAVMLTDGCVVLVGRAGAGV